MIKLKLLSTTRLGLLSALAVFTLNTTPAWAQLPAAQDEAAQSQASAGRAEQQFQDGIDLPDVSPEVEVRDLILQEVPPGAENIRFNLEQIQIDGVTAYSEADLNAVYADKLGTTISLADVYAIAAAMTNKYRNEGYVLTQVLVPPQTIEGGTVKLRVVEGHINRISVQGAGNEDELHLIRRYASRIQTGGALNVEDLERYLLLINDLPGVTARSILSPSQRSGASDLRIIVSRDPYDAFLGLDNFGSRYLGPWQASAAGSANSFFGANERISGQYVIAPDTQGVELSYIGLGYEIPIWTYGTKVILAGAFTNTEPGYDLKPFHVNGRSQYFSAKVEHPFIRARSHNLYGHVMLDWRDVDSQNDLEATREDRIRAARAGGRYEFLDTLIGVGINSASVEFSHGMNFLGASEEGDFGMTRAFGDPQFFKMNAEVQRLQRINEDMNLLMVARGQMASNALLASEEFGVGGPNIGRGYEASEIVGDEGVAGKLELQWNQPYPWSLVQDYQLFSFLDGGRIWNKDATTSAQKTDTIASAGLGLRADFLQDTEAGLAVAFPLNRDVETQQDRDPRVYFNLNRRF